VGALINVAAIMTLLLVAMASAALAIPPGSGELGCDGGTNNANHAHADSASDYVSDHPVEPGDPADHGLETRNDDPEGADERSDNTGGDNCQNESPDHPHD
jgi:hypothetical protein